MLVDEAGAKKYITVEDKCLLITDLMKVQCGRRIQMNRSTNAAKYAAIIMSLIVTVTMVSGCKKNNTDVSSELNKSDIEETSQDMTGSGIEDSDAGSQSAEETAETESDRADRKRF